MAADKPTLKEMVEDTLRDIPSTRDSDIELTIEIWRAYYPEKIQMLGMMPAVELQDLFQLPREDAVKRIRAHIQNDLEKYPPTSLEIALARGMNEITWRKLLGYEETYEVLDLRRRPTDPMGSGS